MTRTRLIPFPFLAAILFFIMFAIAAPLQDNDNGSWSYNFSDDTGLLYNYGADVNSTTETLTLTNSSGQTAPPYNTFGYATTTTIIPTSIAALVNITFDADVPDNTSIRIQLLDECDYGYGLFLDIYLENNSQGFSTSPIDLSSTPSDTLASNDSWGKVSRYRINITLETNDTSVTPSIDNLTLNWVPRRGNLSASPAANTSWNSPLGNQRLTRSSPYYMNTNYPVIRWVNDLGVIYSGRFLRGKEDLLYYKTTFGALYNESYDVIAYYPKEHLIIHKDNGTVISNRAVTGSSGRYTSISEHDTIYLTEMIHDIFFAYNASNWEPKWSYQFYAGHGNNHVTIGDDGMLYTTRGTTDITLYALNPNGTLAWTLNFDPTNENIYVDYTALGDNNTLYINTRIQNKTTYKLINEGKLYAVNLTNQSFDWNYSTGDSTYAILEDDGTIYTASAARGADPAYEKLVYALYPNGTQKWNMSLGVTNDTYYDFIAWGVLSEDGVLITSRRNSSGGAWNQSIIDAINATDGSVLWNTTDNLTEVQYVNGLGGFYTITYTSGYSHSYLNYYDENGTKVWALRSKSIYSGGYSMINNMITDEEGKMYGSNEASDKNSTAYLDIFSLFPWELSTSTPSSYAPCDTVTFNVTTTMQETNLLTGYGNRMQAVMENSDKALLTYDYTLSNGDTVWTGTYQLPAGTSLGTYNYTIEASHADLVTDIPTNFDSPASGTKNTGINATGSFTVVSYGLGHACICDAQCSGGYCVDGVCRATDNYVGSGGDSPSSPTSSPSGGIPDCTENQTLCNGTNLEQCIQGEWITTTCEYGCLEGACLPAPACSDGDVRCSGSTLQVCLEGNWTDSEQCENGCDPALLLCIHTQDIEMDYSWLPYLIILALLAILLFLYRFVGLEPLPRK